MEQYEYMEGPHNAVGLKLLLHRQGDVPLVNDFGDNVQTGIHTFVALSVSKVSTIISGFQLRIYIPNTHAEMLLYKLDSPFTHVQMFMHLIIYVNLVLNSNIAGNTSTPST